MQPMKALRTVGRLTANSKAGKGVLSGVVVSLDLPPLSTHCHTTPVPQRCRGGGSPRPPPSSEESGLQTPRPCFVPSPIRAPPPAPRSPRAASPCRACAAPACARPPCGQNGYLSSRGGYPNRWHSPVSCDHGDSTTSGFDSPAQIHHVVERAHLPRVCSGGGGQRV